MTLSIRDALSDSRGRLLRSGVPNAGQEARWLLEHALGLTSVDLLAHPNRPLDQGEVQMIEALLRRREIGEPLQYILGDAPFFGRDFSVGPGVLIPRPDTEALIEAALSLLPSSDLERPLTFLDWGTGSGCIGATLLLELPRSFAIMADKSPEALGYARANLARYGLSDRARLLLSKTPADLPIQRGECGLVISNPPYIPTGSIPGLMREVRDHEPRLALDGGPDGMDCYRLLLTHAPQWLRPGGLLILEVGDEAQAAALLSLNDNSGGFAPCRKEGGGESSQCANVVKLQRIAPDTA